MKMTIGTDPELFVKFKGESHSAHGLVGGSKYEPQVVNKGAVQVDGMALEFNTDPATSAEEFKSNIGTVLYELRKLVPEEFTFDISPTATFTKDHMDEQPDEAKELGCEPDYNAYTGLANEKPNGEVLFRTGAGHVHIGVDRTLTEIEKRKLCVLCDIFLGVPSLKWDEDKKRRSLYGAAGCYRSKPYGIEYRTLSNAWIKSGHLIDKVYEGCKKAVDNLDNFEAIILLLEQYLIHYDVLQDVIKQNKVLSSRFYERLEEL